MADQLHDEQAPAPGAQPARGNALVWGNANLVFINILLCFTVFVFLSQEYLYGQSTKSLSYNDFVNKELVLFSNSDNERSIPCLVDGVWNYYDEQKQICNFHLKKWSKYVCIWQV